MREARREGCVLVAGRHLDLGRLDLAVLVGGLRRDVGDGELLDRRREAVGQHHLMQRRRGWVEEEGSGAWREAGRREGAGSGAAVTDWSYAAVREKVSLR